MHTAPEISLGAALHRDGLLSRFSLKNNVLFNVLLLCYFLFPGDVNSFL